MKIHFFSNILKLVVGSDIAAADKFNETALGTLFALVSFPSGYTSSLPNGVTYTLHTPEQERIQYKVDSQFYPLKDFLYEDSPQAYCKSKYSTFDSCALIYNKIYLFIYSINPSTFKVIVISFYTITFSIQ